METNVKETGFPSPAQGYEAKSFDFNRILVRNPAATYVMELVETTLTDKGLMPGSLLIVDRSVKPKTGSLVILAYEGEFICRELLKAGKDIAFKDQTHDEIKPREGFIEVFGVVTGVVNRL